MGKNGTVQSARDAYHAAVAASEAHIQREHEADEARAAVARAAEALERAEADDRARTLASERAALTAKLKALGSRLQEAAETVTSLEREYIAAIEPMKRVGIVTGPDIGDAFGIDFPGSVVPAAQHLRKLKGTKRSLPPFAPRPSAAELSRRFSERLSRQSGMLYGYPGGSTTITRVGGVDPDKAVITYSGERT